MPLLVTPGDQGSTSNRPRDKSPNKSGDEKLDHIIRDLVRKRGIVKGRLTKFSNYLSTISSTTLTCESRIDLKLRIQGAGSLLSEFNGIQSKIEELVSDHEIEEQLDQRQHFEDSYYSTVARAESILSDGTEVPNSSNTCQHGTKLSSVKLPTISLPTFDGFYENWLQYRDTFLSLVHNSNEISDVQKFHYLKSSLKGSAELVITSLEITSSNYAVAWELLLNRYDNTRLLVHSHVKALFSLQALSKESPTLIRKLIDTIINNLRALKTLGEPTDSWDTLIIYIVVSKLDKTTEREWEQQKGVLLSSADSKITLKVDHLLKFLKDRADLLETLVLSHNKEYGNVDHKKSNTPYKNSVLQCNVSNNKPPQRPAHKQCPMCKGKHPIYSCLDFINTDFQTKLKLISDHKLCENCLRSGHHVESCRFGPCRQCNKKHNTLIHPNELDPSTSVNTVTLSCLTKSLHSISGGGLPLPAPASHNNGKNQSDRGVYTNLHTNAQCVSVQPVLLSTALVEISDKHNKYHTVCALLDSGSQSCFITHSLCELLNIPLIQSTHEIRGVGNSISQSMQTCNVEIKSRINTYSTRIKCFVLPEITSTLPAVHVQSAQFRIPDHVQLANSKFLGPQNIDILIGADRFWDLLIEGKMRLPNGPFLQNTKFGWIISGPIKNPHNSGPILCNFTQSIDLQLRQFWELDELPKARDTHTDDERACEHSFINTTTRNDDGRFVVNIPLKESADVLGESLSQAKRRFLFLEKKLSRVPSSYKQLYTDFMREYIDLGHMSPISAYAQSHYFMPHHGVFREHSTTTKLRVVFDASAVTSSGKSLNNIQLVGPPIQGDLLGILLRFRQFKYTAIADCEKMYRQVLVSPTQRDLQLILWRDDPSLPLQVYQLNTVTYGQACSPFLSVRCLKKLADDCTDPHVKRVIRDDFYVDDLLTSCDDKHELLNICKSTADVLKSGCFPLRKWMFNFHLDDSSDSFNEATFRDLNLGEYNQCKTLGLGWCNDTDEFNFNTQFQNNNQSITKRLLLSMVSQIYDPLGLLSPTVMIGKVLLQKLWLLKLDWDDSLPTDVVQAWNRFINNLSLLNSIKVPRHVFQSNPIRTELHIFTDASQIAYGACLYVRTICNNKIVVRLLISKGKVAPLKPVSIPRLELCGALLGARLYDKVRNSLTHTVDDVMFWSDSTIVIGWLRMAPSLLKTFVQNRVAEIHELTSTFTWRHVSGKVNPADLVSRGVGLDELSNSNLWWEGPRFLHDHGFNANLMSHSATNVNEISINELPEIKPSAVKSLLITQETSTFPFERFSQLNRLSRVAAYVLRFIHNTCNKKNRLKDDKLAVDELRNAVNALARMSQLESFPDTYKLLVTGKSVNTKDKLSSLNLFLDNQRLIRVGGRIKNAPDFDYNKKHPILLSSRHHFTVLLFRYEHVQSLHAAPQALLYRVRETWWPLAGRSLARRVTHHCVTCSRVKGKTLTPLMGNLPKERITASYPFLRVGVDYAGPVLILNRKGRGAKMVKGYICLFICFATKAIHLELVSDLSTSAYLLALKRFISRRGKPTEIYSDNGRNFLGLKNEFAQFISTCSSDIVEYANSQAIKFSFIPPYSPHFGGLWEAGVKSCKYHLRRVIGNAHLTFEEYTTVLAQIEAVLNSRPLVPLSSDPRDFLPLSPGHFLVGRPLTAPVCDGDLQDTPVHRLSRYQKIEQIRQHFWSRWAKEYISELQTRTKWRKNTTELKPDTFVIIKDSNLPPLKWQLGRVLKTIPGNDGISRVADIQTASGIIRRSYSKICPLTDN